MGKWWCHLPQKRVFAGESDSSCRDFAQLEFRLIEVCIIRTLKGLLILDLGALAGLDERLWWKEAPATLSVEKSPTEEKGRCTMASPHMELRRQGLASDLALPVTLLEPAFSQAIGAGSLTEVHIGLS